MQHIIWRIVTRVVLGSVFLCTVAPSVRAQEGFVEKKVGHIYRVSVPYYMTQAYDLNSAASFQYQNLQKDAYVIVVDDSKEDLRNLSTVYTGAREFFDEFIKDYQKDAKKRKVTAPQEFSLQDNKLVQAEMTYQVDDAELYMVITIVETPGYFYKVLSWTTLSNKEKLQKDLLSIARTIREG